MGLTKEQGEGEEVEVAEEGIEQRGKKKTNTMGSKVVGALLMLGASKVMLAKNDQRSCQHELP